METVGPKIELTPAGGWDSMASDGCVGVGGDGRGDRGSDQMMVVEAAAHSSGKEGSQQWPRAFGCRG